MPRWIGHVLEIVLAMVDGWCVIVMIWAHYGVVLGVEKIMELVIA